MKGEKILKMLEDSGFEAYYVGGCVRDMLRGCKFKDVDIATNALPEQIMSVFSHFTVVPTGIKHGTVTVIDDGIPFEITAYRVDGEYIDNRRPESVKFTSSLTDDLARRDFTMNAIAMDRRGNIVDPYGGANDIKNGLIRCVGNPEKRFNEDALRIMRAVRFASQLGFAVDSETSSVIHAMKNNLRNISRERIRDELDKLICGQNCVEVLLDYSDIITEIIPEFAPSIGFDQHSDYHKYTVWEHTIRSMDAAPGNDVFLRRALLFHDIGKPSCVKYDESGKGHFKGHPQKSAEMARQIMKNLRYDSRSIADTALLIKWHGEKIKNRTEIKKLLNQLGEKNFIKLLEMKSCDDRSKNDFVKDRIPQYFEIAEIGGEIIGSGECYSLKQLSVNGAELERIGFRGSEIGDALKEILNLIIENKLENNRESIMEFLKRR